MKKNEETLTSAEATELQNFLFLENMIGQAKDAYLTKEQKTELNGFYQDYLENPDNVVSMEDMKSRLMKKYGLSTAG